MDKPVLIIAKGEVKDYVTMVAKIARKNNSFFVYANEGLEDKLHSIMIIFDWCLEFNNKELKEVDRLTRLEEKGEKFYLNNKEIKKKEIVKKENGVFVKQGKIKVIVYTVRRLPCLEMSEKN